MRQYLAAHAPGIEVVQLAEAHTTDYISRKWKVGTDYRLSIQQGVSMGRRSQIEAEARKSGNVVTSVSVGGATAYIASGEIEVPPSALVS